MAADHNKDELVNLGEVVSKVENTFNKNKNIFYIVFAVLALGIGGFIFWQKDKQQKSITAAEEIFKAQNYFEQDSLNLALNGSATVVGFNEIIEEYGNTPSGNIAKYYVGVTHLKEGKFDEALESLQDFDAKGTIMPMLKTGLIGDVYAEKGELEKAFEQYSKAGKLSVNEAIAPYYMEKAGLLAIKLGKKAEAVTIFKELETLYPNSEQGKTAEKYRVGQE
jgi:tetratricopeptide (TPR) repeat protein